MVLAFLIVALVLFILAALAVPMPPWVSGIGWLGLAFFTAAQIVPVLH